MISRWIIFLWLSGFTVALFQFPVENHITQQKRLSAIYEPRQVIQESQEEDTDISDPETRRRQCTYTHVFTSAGQAVALTSDNHPNSYCNNADTSYCYSSPLNTKMSIYCDDFNIENHPRCKYDKFIINGEYLCGHKSWNRTSKSNEMNIRFRSNRSSPTSKIPYRFKCNITAVATSTPSPTTTTTTTTTTATTIPSVTPSVPIAPQSFLSAVSDCTCGNRNNNAARIVNGTVAQVSEFPWRCYLKTKMFSFFCGCSIISSNFVLTAAHCTHEVMPLSKSDVLSVVVGAYDMSKSEVGRMEIPVDKVIQHKQYNTTSQDNDIALLHLSKPLIFSKTISPVCLPFKIKNKDFSGAAVTASGWGRTASGGDTSPVLRKIDLPVLNTKQCQKYYGTSITDQMFCTYQNGKDTCQGDSGGSIDIKDANSKSYYAIGVVSWGISCAQKDKPGVYTKITSFLDWIQTNTGEIFCKI